MDLWFHSIRICWWRVLFLMSVFQDYLSSMLDCPPTCSCSQIEIYCNKSDNGRFFPLLALQETGNNGTSIDIAELFKNITTIHIENWTGLQTLRDVDMELYTGLQRLEPYSPSPSPLIPLIPHQGGQVQYLQPPN
ncbi:NT-3 growth factor receptor-like [Notothenia coriiceps]|uniref:NT-3 growth factor receptor-like n=1 Tax=Notothenia coriiceps TaxID=8208 RepID=A0A6I9MZX2_9TELE|nr:PREDICTED: NT-3 growth factor receptor-like [Notothenia coriiceps]